MARIGKKLVEVESTPMKNPKVLPVPEPERAPRYDEVPNTPTKAPVPVPVRQA